MIYPLWLFSFIHDVLQQKTPENELQILFNKLNSSKAKRYNDRIKFSIPFEDIRSPNVELLSKNSLQIFCKEVFAFVLLHRLKQLLEIQFQILQNFSFYSFTHTHTPSILPYIASTQGSGRKSCCQKPQCAHILLLTCLWNGAMPCCYLYNFTCPCKNTNWQFSLAECHQPG